MAKELYNYNEIELNNLEKLSNEEIDAYISNKEADVPDLWSRISAGFDMEVASMNNSNVVSFADAKATCDANKSNVNKKLRRKYFGLAAAAVLCVLIAIPVLFNSGLGVKDETSDTRKRDKVENNYTSSDEAPSNSGYYAESNHSDAPAVKGDAAETVDAESENEENAAEPYFAEEVFDGAIDSIETLCNIYLDMK